MTEIQIRDLRLEVSRHITSGESPDDVLMMIEMLSLARAQQRNTSPGDETNGVAKLLCILFDVFKTEAYRAFAQRLRLSFRGIATDPMLQLRFVGRLPAVFLRDEPRRVFQRFARLGINEVDMVAEAYDIDRDKLQRLYSASARVLQLRLHVDQNESFRIMERVFRVCARERARVANPFGWILDAAITLGSRSGLGKPSAPTFEQLVRDVDAEADDNEADAGPDLLLEQ